jgi:hypothetical protein
VGTLAAVNAGCAGAQLRPDPGPCPQEAQDNLERLFDPVRGGKLFISLVNKPAPELPKKQEFIAFKEGPVTARVIRLDNKKDSRGIPVGSLLFGYLWPDTDFGPQYAMLRFNRVQTPEGKSYQVCIVGFDGDGLITKEEGSSPGAAIVPRFGYAMPAWTKWPPPPGPYDTDGG